MFCPHSQPSLCFLGVPMDPQFVRRPDDPRMELAITQLYLSPDRTQSLCDVCTVPPFRRHGGISFTGSNCQGVGYLRCVGVQAHNFSLSGQSVVTWDVMCMFCRINSLRLCRMFLEINLPLLNFEYFSMHSSYDTSINGKIHMIRLVISFSIHKLIFSIFNSITFFSVIGHTSISWITFSSKIDHAFVL